MSGGLPSFIGESGLDGWPTFLVYILVASLCAANARHSVALADAGGRRIALAQSRRRFWVILAALLLLLGLTRILDLQLLAANAARGVLRNDGVYSQRSGLQIGLIAAIGVFGTIGLAIALATYRRAEGSVVFAMAGAALLVIFTIVRTISLHAVDHLLRVALLGFQFNDLIENGLLVCIAGAGMAFWRQLRGEQAAARLRALSIRERRRMLGERRRSGRS